MVKVRKKRDLMRKQKRGCTGSPEKSNERLINKLFDFRRKKAIEIGNIEGIVMNYKIREKLTRKVSDTQACSIKA